MVFMSAAKLVVSHCGDVHIYIVEKCEGLMDIGYACRKLQALHLVSGRKNPFTNYKKFDSMNRKSVAAGRVKKSKVRLQLRMLKHSHSFDTR